MLVPSLVDDNRADRSVKAAAPRALRSADCEPASNPDPTRIRSISLIGAKNHCTGGVPIGADRDPAW
jgi:hypothetical protein